MFVVQTAPATEPLTIAEVKLRARIDGTNAEPAPGAPTVALAGAGAGNVDNGAHRYLVTFVTADGETEAGTPSSSVTVADKSVNGRVAVSAIPLGGSAVTARKLYRTVAGGSTYLLLATIADNTTTTYTDNVADASLGAGAPSTNTTADVELAAFIKSVRQHAEQELGRWLITQTIDHYRDAFPESDDDPILLPPLQSVSSITYIDDAGVEQTWSASEYRVDATSIPARITPAYGYTWPTTREVTNAVKVRFVAGYGAASAVPQCVKDWMLVQIKHRYDDRDGAKPPSEYIHRLLDPERVHGRL